MNRPLFLALLLSGLSLPALAAPSAPAELAAQVVQRAELVDHSRSLAADTAVSTASLERLSAHTDWRVRLQAGAALSWRLSPEVAQVVASVDAEPTRAGLPRFMGEQFRTEAAAPVMLQRFLQPGADEWTRLAIAEMLPRTKGDWSEAVAASWAAEPSAAVRTVLVESIRHGDVPVALAVLAEASADPSAEVRAGAMRAIGWMDEGGSLEAQLQLGLDDVSPEVRAFAARSLGWRHLGNSWSDLVAHVADSDALVRLNTLRALERIDPKRAASEPAVKAARGDADAKVARAATQIVGS